jgi:hypothetical protein
MDFGRQFNRLCLFKDKHTNHASPITLDTSHSDFWHKIILVMNNKIKLKQIKLAIAAMYFDRLQSHF